MRKRDSNKTIAEQTIIFFWIFLFCAFGGRLLFSLKTDNKKRDGIPSPPQNSSL